MCDRGKTCGGRGKSGTHGQLDIVHAFSVICEQFSRLDDPLALEWDSASDLIGLVITDDRSFEEVIGRLVELSGVNDGQHDD